MARFEAKILPLYGDFPADYKGLTVQAESRPRLEDKRKQEERLKLFREIFFHSTEPVGVINLEGRYIEQNPAHKALLGYEDHELTSATPSIHMGKENFDLVTQELRKTGFCRGEFVSRKKDGSTVLIELTAFTVRNEYGNPICYVGIKRDITKQKKDERALRETEERFKQLTENIREVFWMTDPAKKEAIYVSPAYEKIWGRSLESLYSSPTSFLDSILPEDRERIREALHKQMLGTYDEEYRIAQPKGQIVWIRDRAFPILNAQGQVYRVVGVAEDITEKKVMEQRLLEQSRMAAVGSMAAGIAHEIRNPLFGISSAAHVLAQETAGNPNLKELGESMLSEIHRLNKLLTNLLIYARPQRIEPIWCKPKDLIDEFVALHDSLINENRLRLAVQIFPENAEIYVDRNQLRQVILNIGLNAIQAATPDTVIDIVSRIEAEKIWHLEVKNDGAGIPATVLGQIFEPFFSTKSEGSGLGLSICKKIVEDHHGTIVVESRPTEGTLFHVTIPFVALTSGASSV